MSVGLVIVSHSEKLAQGVVDVAEQMASDVAMVAAGGTDESGIGTSLEKVMDALTAADSGDGVVVLCDLGSAVMTAESALEFMGNPETVVLADAPLVEGAVAAAVAAQAGGSLGKVKFAAETALSPAPETRVLPESGRPESGLGDPAPVDSAPVDSEPASSAPTGLVPDQSSSDVGAVTAVVTLINPMGLHARPAAVLAGALGPMDVEIEINGVDGQSVMLLMTLGAGMGKELNISATGPDAQRAVDLVRTEVESGFGEI